jgi:O-acetyl-ADP-ribose deacetylase (regulator of RNase III)
MFVHETGALTNPRFIINFPTKRHWKGKSRMEDIERGLVDLVDQIQRRRIGSVAIPPLGSGLGGLDWRQVRVRIEAALLDLRQVRVVVYEPNGEGDSRLARRTRNVSAMTAGRAALVVLIHRYRAGLLDPFVSLLEVHKLLYFMQEAGQALRLRYAKAPYGPYAENLRHVLHAVEGHLVSGYGSGGDEPDKQLELVPGAVADAEAFLKRDAPTRARFQRVADLVDGFETPFGLELLSTVHWVAAREGATNASEAIACTYAWGDRKKRFTRRQIALALATLEKNGWLGAEIAERPA